MGNYIKTPSTRIFLPKEKHRLRSIVIQTQKENRGNRYIHGTALERLTKHRVIKFTIIRNYKT